MKIVITIEQKPDGMETSFEVKKQIGSPLECDMADHLARAFEAALCSFRPGGPVIKTQDDVRERGTVGNG